MGNGNENLSEKLVNLARLSLSTPSKGEQNTFEKLPILEHKYTK